MKRKNKATAETVRLSPYRLVDPKAWERQVFTDELAAVRKRLEVFRREAGVYASYARLMERCRAQIDWLETQLRKL